MSEKIDEKYANYINRHIESFEVFGNKEKFKYLFAYRNSVYGFRILIEILKLNNQYIQEPDLFFRQKYLYTSF